MADKVEANYEMLGSIAKQFSQEADAIEQMLKNLESNIDQLEGGGWIGRGANAFYAELRDEVLPGVERLTQALEDASRTTSEIAKLFREAEETASNRFKMS